MNTLKKLCYASVVSMTISSLSYAKVFTKDSEILPDLQTVTQAADTASIKLNKLSNWYWDYSLYESPESATFLGKREYGDRWSDNSPQAMLRIGKVIQALQTSLKQVDVSKLSTTEQVTYQLLKQELDRQLESLQFSDHLLAPANHLSGVQQEISQTLENTPKRDKQDFVSRIARLKAIPVYLEQTQANLNEGIKQGITQPQITLKDIPRQIEALIPSDPWQSPLLLSFKELPSNISATEQKQLKQEAEQAYLKSAKPALQKYHEYMVKTYIPNARKEIAFTQIPNGKAWYAFKVRNHTTTDLSPEQIHQIGLNEVKRIRAAMQDIIVKTGFKGDLAQFFDYVRKDKQFVYGSEQALLERYRAIAKQVDGELPRLFTKMPRLPYGVNPVPMHIAPTQTAAYYMQGSVDAGRAGIFYINTYDLPSRLRWEGVALTLHEAVPGHHFQIALSQEQENTPEFRRNGRFTAFVEGWGLYAESLGYELGLYKDPYDQFGQLTAEMWRSIRLVVDTGMHALGWSREQAIQYFTENAGRASHDIIVEVDRYIGWPGQALAYKIGQLKIQELREYAQKELGTQFDVRHFHDKVLANGALPLTLLETEVKQWVAKTKHEQLAAK